MNWSKSLWGGAANLGRSDNETIQQRIRRHVERRGGTPAVWFAPDQFCSYSQMNENATVISQALKSASGASSPRVCFPMPRGSSALYGFLGAIECGTCCPLDGKLRQNEFDEAYSVLLPDVVLSSEPQSIGVKVAAAAGIAIVIYEVSSDHGNCRIIDVKPAKNVRRADRLMTLTSGEAPAVLMRTSGTTAQPKLVGLTHANVLAATDTMRVAFELTESDVCITPMPLHHVHGLIAAALSALSAGSSIHCCETFSPRSFDQALRDYAPTWLTAAPALHIAMNDYYAGQNSTPSIRTLRCFRSSSAPLPPASIARLEELYAAPLLETYGLTETASTLCSNRLPPGKRKPGSVGQAISADLKIVDPEGHEGRKFGPVVVGRAISAETCAKVTTILKRVVEAGTGEKARPAGYTAAGKTGTAQKIDQRTHAYSKKEYISSFVGFAPAAAPRLVILVMVDTPVGDIYGGSVAAPVFKAVAEQSLAYLQVAPDDVGGRMLLVTR